MKSKYLLAVIAIFMFSTAYSEENKWVRLLDTDTYDAAVNPKNYNSIYFGGSGRRVWKSTDGGNSFEKLVLGFEGTSAHFNNVLVHPHDTNIVFVGGLNFCSIRRSLDAGATWDPILFLPVEQGCLSLNGKSMIFKPDNPDTMYIGDFLTGQIFRTGDRGNTFDTIAHIKTTYWDVDENGELFEYEGPLTIGSLGIREDSTNIILAGGTNSEVHMSHDGGYTWTHVDNMATPDSLQLDSEITRITFSKRNPLVGYAVITYLFYLNKNNGGLYKTVDGGYNWDLIAFPDTSMWAVATREYAGKDEVVIGGYTEDFYAPDEWKVPGVGIVKRSIDGGETWYTYEDIDWWIKEPQFGPVANMWSLRYYGDIGYEKLYMCSEAGAFVMDNPNSITYQSENDANFKVFVKHHSTLGIDYTTNSTLGNQIVLTIYNTSGQTILSKTFDSSDHIYEEIGLGDISKGVYICQLIDGSILLTRKIIID